MAGAELIGMDSVRFARKGSCAALPLFLPPCLPRPATSSSVSPSPGCSAKHLGKVSPALSAREPGPPEREQRQSKRAPRGGEIAVPWPGSIPALSFSSGGREAPRLLPGREEWAGCRWRRPTLLGAPKQGSHSGDNGTPTGHGAATHHAG